MRSNIFRITWLVAILVSLSVACQALGRIQDQAGSTRATVESAATQIDEGGALLSTVRAVGTQVAGEGYLETLQEVGTQVAGEGFVETIQAVATQVDDSGLAKTAWAFATQQGPGLMATAMAVATEQGPGAIATVQAFVTQAAQATPSPDIPVVDGDKELYFQSGSLVSYMTPLPYLQVLDFYKTQMPAAGWTKLDQGWFESGSAATLNYTKDSRQATITLGQSPGSNQTMVLILIKEK
jgi:hypothetical protein